MIDSLYLAWQYLKFNKARTLILVGCITIIAGLPMALEILLNESERQLAMRADSSPLLIGAKGSALDLVMNSIYFGDEVPELFSALSVGVAAPQQVLPIPGIINDDFGQLRYMRILYLLWRQVDVREKDN